jgi:hypothetical protein
VARDRYRLLEHTRGLPVCRGVKQYRSIPLALTLGVLLLVVIAGCLSDPIDGPEVKPRVVTGPPRVWFIATNYQAPSTGDLIVRWNHTPSDTQQNFKGYFVRVYSSQITDTTLNAADKLIALIAADTVLKKGNKVDTSITFPNFTQGRYTVFVSGMQFADSLILSRDSSSHSDEFDPRPLENPTNLRATSMDVGRIGLAWDVSPANAGKSLIGYRLYYKDPDSSRVTLRPGLLPIGDRGVVDLPGYPSSSSNQTPEITRRYTVWLKAVRNDSTEFFVDSSLVTWSGAVRLPNLSDSSRGFKKSLYFSGTSTTPSLIDDSVDAAGQLQLSISGSSVTLTGANGAMLNERVDTAPSLDSVFYTTPITSGFTVSSYTLPDLPVGSGGIVLYLQWTDQQNLKGKLEYARLFIAQQADGTFVSSRGEVHIVTSFQPAKNLSGTDHLPYY